MEALKDKALIYDSNCPLCVWYTDKFIRIGALEKNGRICFNDLDEKYAKQLDARRSRHEIPLLDTRTGKVVYGLDGLTLVLAGRFPFFGKVLTNHFCKQFVQPLYSFISYNRRIIVPSKIAEQQRVDCAPDFSLGWRLALIACCFALYYLLVTGLDVRWNISGINLFLVYPVIPVVFTLYFTKEDWKQKLWNMLGDFSVTNLSTALLFSPLFLFAYVAGSMPDWFYIATFIVFQIRLTIHFLRRVEHKRYLT